MDAIKVNPKNLRVNMEYSPTVGLKSGCDNLCSLLLYEETEAVVSNAFQY